MPAIDEGMARYLAARDQRRQQEIEAAYPSLEAALSAFVAGHRDDPGLPVVLARMLREMAVAAFVRGTMHTGVPYREIRQPPDAVMLHEALETIRSMDDLYPAFSLFDRRHGEQHADDGREGS